MFKNKFAEIENSAIKESMFEPRPTFNTAEFKESNYSPELNSPPPIQKHKSDEIHQSIEGNIATKYSYLIPSDPASNSNSNGPSHRDERSKIVISMRSSMLNSEPNDVRSSNTSNNGKLLSPAIITPMKKSQVDSELRSVNYGYDLPSMRLMRKKVSELTVKKEGEGAGLRKTEQDSEWL